MLLLHLAKWNTLPAITQQHQKGTKFHQKARNLLVHIVESSTSVVKVDIKVINASLTQNQCLQCVTPLLTHDEIPRLRNATEMNNDGVIKLGDVCYQTEPILSNFFPERLLINFLFTYSFSIWLAVSCFPFEKLLLNVRTHMTYVTSSSSPRNDVAVLG